MTLTQQKQRLLAILFICALVCILLLSFTAFEVIQHLNGMWHVIHGITSAGPKAVSRYP
jgi:hypothetical protein